MICRFAGSRLEDFADFDRGDVIEFAKRARSAGCSWKVRGASIVREIRKGMLKAELVALLGGQ